MNRIFTLLSATITALLPAALLVACSPADGDSAPSAESAQRAAAEARQPRRGAEDLRRDIADAAQIVEGAVVRIDYRELTVEGLSAKPLPHTFVTYRVDRSFKGSASGGELTLRFIGGLASDGRILLVSDMPLFQVGDHDILFVRENGESACPLVGCEAGRYRVIRGGLYSDDGLEIRLDTSGAVRRGRPRALPELQSVRIGHRTLGLHASSGEGESGLPPDTGERSAGALRAADFSTLLQAVVDEELERSEPRAAPSPN